MATAGDKVLVSDYNTFKDKVNQALTKANKTYTWSETITSGTIAKASSLTVVYDSLDEAKTVVQANCAHDTTVKTSHNSHNSHNSPVHRYWCNSRY